MSTKRHSTQKRSPKTTQSGKENSTIFLNNKSVFKDDNDHPYTCECCDGLAYCTKVGCKENKNAPQSLLLGYPLLRQIEGTKRETACRQYTGIPFGTPLTYYDIAVRYGVIGRYKFSAAELNLMDKLARSANMEWFVTTREGHFKDGETGGQMSAKKALKDLVEGLDDSNFNNISKSDLITFVRSLASLL